MKQLIHLITALLLIFALLFANATTALANEGDSEHSLEMEVNGYHISLSSQNEWVKGDNTVVVTLTDEMGMPVSDAEWKEIERIAASRD